MKLSKHQRGLLEYLLTEKLPLSEVRPSTYRILRLRYGLIEHYLEDGIWQLRLTPKGRKLATELAEETRLKEDAK